MMGVQAASGQLFYDFCLDDHVPSDHLLRGIDGHLDYLTSKRSKQRQKSRNLSDEPVWRATATRGLTTRLRQLIARLEHGCQIADGKLPAPLMACQSSAFRPSRRARRGRAAGKTSRRPQPVSEPPRRLLEHWGSWPVTVAQSKSSALAPRLSASRTQA
jgi:hypothetical protein